MAGGRAVVFPIIAACSRVAGSDLALLPSAEVGAAPTPKEEFMPDAELIMLAKRSRARAKQVLARAKGFRDADAKRKMRRVAVSYKNLARRLEHEAGGPDKA